MTTKKAKTTKAKVAKVEEKTTATPEIKNEETKVEETSTATFKHIVSEEDLQNNPELEKEGLKAGDEIELSEEEKTTVGPNIPETKESAVETQEIVNKDEKDAPKEGMSFYEAEVLIKDGSCIALPEWSGFWFKDKDSEAILVLTKDNQVLDNPMEEYKSRNDWKEVEPTEEQLSIIEAYYDSLELEKEKEETLKNSKAIFYNRKFNGEFKKLENPLSLEDLKQRKSLPTDVSLKDSEFLFEDGSVYNIGQQGFSNKDGKSLLDNLK